MTAILAALTASAAAWLAAPATVRRSWVEQATRRGRDPTSAPVREDAPLRRLRGPLAGLALVGAYVVVGGFVGVLVGLVAGAASWRVLSATESLSERRRRETLRRELPLGVHLLAACLRSGAAVDSALSLVARAMPGPVAEEFDAVCQRIRLGVEPDLVWASWSADPELMALARAFERAQSSGASVADTVATLSGELRGRVRARIEQRAKSVDVRASAPLGVCFLPAFVLLGVVPLVVGIFTSMRLFG